MANPDYQLTTSSAIVLAEQSGVKQLLDKVRPHWKAKQLIQRVERLITIDPSSACQRIFNASIHDLKEKIILAGLDIAKEAAEANRYPEVSKAEHVDNLDVKRTINLAFYMGLLTRPEWRRLSRVYDIRRDLEHEDDEYEATLEDCVYVFKTCVEVVLAKDPVQLLKLTDVKGLIEQPDAAMLGHTTLDDYAAAPTARQIEIYRFLISYSLDDAQPDIVRQNAFNALGVLHAHCNQEVILTCASEFVARIGRRGPRVGEARVAYQAGILPYLKKSQLIEMYSSIGKMLERHGYTFRDNASHGKLLRRVGEVGGIRYCPSETLEPILRWLVLCYIGERGGYGRGRGRNVFFSNSGAPLALELIKNSGMNFSEHLNKLRDHDPDIRRLLGDEYIARRFEEILDIFNE